MKQKETEGNYDQKKGDDTMSATIQNYAYIFGKEKPGVKIPVMSEDRLKQIKADAAKYRLKSK